MSPNTRTSVFKQLAVFLLAAPSLHAGTIFSHHFNGAAVSLNATAVEEGTGSWTAASIFSQNGAFGGNAGSATLPFIPASGLVYTLDARVSITGNSPNWLALGFANGQSSSIGTSHRFVADTVKGTAWMLVRGNATVSANSTFNGLATSPAGMSWLGDLVNADYSTQTGTLDLRIMLDTTAPTWTVRMLAKTAAAATYTVVRPLENVVDVNRPYYTSVGFALANTGPSGIIDSFSLTSSGGAADTDTDGLDDAWEILHFGNLSQGPLDDYDGDGATNRAELDAATNPADPTDLPLVSQTPISDGNPATDENGYAGSAINSVAFAQNNLITIGAQQIIAYYRRHATDASDPANNTIVVGRRNVGETQWELFSTNFTSYNINDTHNVISCAIDGDGFLHMSWGMHGNPLRYAKSTAPVVGPDPIIMTSLGTAGVTGQESSVTYPKFQTLPDGDVVFLFREGGSGNGDWYLNRYDTDTDTWAPIHANPSGVAQPLMLGLGAKPDNCFYPDRLTLGPDGMLHLAGVFRYGTDSPTGQPGYQTNHRYVYLRSPDGGTTWQRSDGSTIDLPVVENAGFLSLGASHLPEIIKDLPEGHSIMNESGMTTDRAGRPIIANWWADNAATGDHRRQYHLFIHDGTTWQQRTVSARNIDDPATRILETMLGSSWMGRPVVLTDADNRILVLYADVRFPGITVVFSEPLAQDPGRNHWSRTNLTHENLGFWEATYDEKRWKQEGVLHLLYQNLPGSGASYTTQNNSTPVAVLEWNARAYFNGPIRWKVDAVTTPGQAAISASTRAGFRYDLRTSPDLDFSAPPATIRPGNGAWQDFATWQMNEPRRFWRLERTEEATNDL